MFFIYSYQTWSAAGRGACPLRCLPGWHGYGGGAPGGQKRGCQRYSAKPTIENTQDIGTYFTGYGFEVDLSTAAVDKVKIPKKWDDSFTAFNQVVGESGLTLADYKGKTGGKMDGTLPGALRWRNRHLLCAAGI